MVVHAGLPGAFDQIPPISSSGASTHQGMPFGHASTGDARTSSSLIRSSACSAFHSILQLAATYELSNGIWSIPALYSLG